jgi:hypothetical protein
MNVFTYRLTYVVLSIALTTLAAWRMHRSGRILLAGTFSANRELADSINRSIGAGFFFFMFGFIVVTQGQGESVLAAPAILPGLGLIQIGFVCVVLGVLHFLHIFILSRLVAGIYGRAYHRDSTLS